MSNFESNYEITPGVSPLSYASFRNDILNFKKSGGLLGSDFSKFDDPVNYYFKILFYFNESNNESTNIHAGNLLCVPLASTSAPDLKEDDNSSSNTNTPSIDYNDENNYVFRNSAYNFLKINGEDERAELLKDFVFLLSNINSNTPWYFSEITGLSEALKRNFVNKVEFGDERKKISIKCLQDSYDAKIGTLMDLYRSACFSYQLKKEIVPANLRKFSMGIYIFPQTVKNLHSMLKKYDLNKYTSAAARLGINANINDLNLSGAKYIEFRNCEFDYNSQFYSDLNNKEGNRFEGTIDIYFDDCYEVRYNEFLMKTIGDEVSIDLMRKYEPLPTDVKQQREYVLKERIDVYKKNPPLEKIERKPISKNEITIPTNLKQREKILKDRIDASPLKNAINQVTGKVISEGKSILKRAYLGNIYTASLSNVKDQVNDLMSGNIFNTVNAIQDYVEHANSKKESNEGIGNKRLNPNEYNPAKISKLTKLNNAKNLRNQL